MCKRPLIVAHRGYSGLYPENTLIAVKEAVKLGVDGVEIDVRVTGDGVLVLMHDESVDRTTNGKGKVRDLGWSEIKTLDAGSWKSLKFSGEPVPTIDEVLAETVGRVVLHIEIKELGIEQQVIESVKQAGGREWVLITSFYPEVISRAKKIEPSIPCSLIIGWLSDAEKSRRGEPVHRALNCGANALALYKGRATHEIISYAHKRLLSTAVWTVNEISEAKAFTDMGADAIVTDYPDTMLNYLRRVVV
ncbi:MAG: glycerophosphodiester phosphodiesterase family protein [Nitrososphaerota archaeon]